MERVRILLAGGHLGLRRGTKLLLEAESDFRDCSAPSRRALQTLAPGARARFVPAHPATVRELPWLPEFGHS